MQDFLNPLTSRHQVVSKDGQTKVSCQSCQGRLDAREFLREASRLRPKVAESSKAEDAMGVVAQYVVPVGQQVMSFNELKNKDGEREVIFNMRRMFRTSGLVNNH